MPPSVAAAHDRHAARHAECEPDACRRHGGSRASHNLSSAHEIHNLTRHRQRQLRDGLYRIIVCLPLALYPSCRCCTSPQSQGFSSIPISYRANPRSGLDEFVLRIPVPYQKAPGTQCSRQRLCSGQTTVKCFYSGLCAAQSLSQPCCKCVATFNTVLDAANAFFSSEGRIADKALFSSPFFCWPR